MNQIFYASYTRFPAEKAHALYMAKACDAFAGAGCEVRIIVPARFKTARENFKTFYNLEHDVVLVRLACIDLMWLRFAKSLVHKIGLLSFGVRLLLYVYRYASQQTVFVTNDVLLALLVGFLGVRVVYEVHDYPSGQWWLYRLAARYIYKIQTNNQLKVPMVVQDFGITEDRVYAAHNGVTMEDFAIDLSQSEARRQLDLDPEKKYAVYTGHLYEWKGAAVLAEAAASMPEVNLLFVGGTNNDIKTFRQKFGAKKNVHILGHKPHHEIPHYLRAADVLVLPNSAESTISRYHTSPMKLFEYMASGRPIVASAIPSISEILNKGNAILVKPDDPEALATAIQMVVRDSARYETTAQQASRDVQKFTWSNRAQLILGEFD